MNITNKLNAWNEVLSKANMNVKRVVDHQTAEAYFEVAKYNDNNSFVCNIVKGIFKKTGVDLRFSFINISSVLFTTKNFNELEEYVESMEFSMVDEHFAYEKMTVAEYKNKSFINSATAALSFHGIDFFVVHDHDLDAVKHIVNIPQAEDSIVGPGTVVISKDDNGNTLSTLGKKTAAHINTIKNI